MLVWFRGLHSLCSTYNTFLLCLAKPLVIFDTIPSSFKSSLNLRVVVINHRGASLPTLWVLASFRIINVSILDLDEQHVSLEVDLLGQRHLLTKYSR